ncbi:MAG: DUF853 family protein [Rhodocyclaceae bacterium]|nr:DUF853 family protein [Rhodocyclaceae bacterium]
MNLPLLIAKHGVSELVLLPALANRHGLITGATGTGKTVTLQRLTEQFSAIGVPVFLADVKGDLSGLGAAGVASDKLQKRLDSLGITDWQPRANPVVFWDVLGASGHPVRATVSDMGPLLLARLLGLNETQEGVLQIVFRVADDGGLLLLDLKDLRTMVQHVGENAATFKTQYGNVSAASIGAIQRGLLTLEAQGGDRFFGEPMLDIADLMQTQDGRGVVNILAADQLMNSPKLYATFLLWLLAELFEQLPEAGDLEKPKLVFFFDEAHLLFDGAPAALVDKVEQVVRLIRSKGIGIYFVTQNPLDVPDKVLGQLGNRVQHALRAFTPRDQKAVKAAAETMRANPAFNAATAITELGVGEALVSFLDEKGRPHVVERAFVLAPGSRLGPLTAAERQAAIQSSLLFGHYEKTADRESAHEILTARAAAAAPEQKAGAGGTAPAKVGAGGTAPAKVGAGGTAPQSAESGGNAVSDLLFGRTGPRGGQTDGLAQTMAKTVVRSIGSQVGRALLRGVLGSLLGGRR